MRPPEFRVPGSGEPVVIVVNPALPKMLAIDISVTVISAK